MPYFATVSKPIDVGAYGTIKVRLNGIEKLGSQTQIIVIRANTDPSEVRLLLKGLVVPRT